LQHRVMSWIGDAAIATKTGLLDNIKVPVLIIAGRRDLFLPSEQEASSSKLKPVQIYLNCFKSVHLRVILQK